MAANGEDITVLNPDARHNLGVAVFHRCKIRYQGSVGYFAASMFDGPEVVIEGNAGWALGENMMSGKISVSKNAGASVGSAEGPGRENLWPWGCR